MGGEPADFDPARLGETLRRARLQHPDQPTLEDMAKRVGVHLSMIGNVETGVATPSAATLAKWLIVLDLPSVYLEDWLDWMALKRIGAALDERGVGEKERDHVLYYARFALSEARGQPRDQRKAV